MLFPLIPAPEGLTTMSMQAFGLFIGIMILWNFVGIDWPSFLCMAMIAIYGLMKPAAIFSSGLGNATIGFLMVFFMLSHVLSQVGFSRRMAIWFMTNKIARKSSWAFVIMFLFGANVRCLLYVADSSAPDLFADCRTDLPGTGLSKG